MKQIDSEMLENAAKLPDEQLSEMIYAVVTAAGGSRMQARAAASSAGKVRKKLQSVTMNEVQELTKNIDEETMNRILEAVKKNGGLHG